MIFNLLLNGLMEFLIDDSASKKY